MPKRDLHSATGQEEKEETFSRRGGNGHKRAKHKDLNTSVLNCLYASAEKCVVRFNAKELAKCTNSDVSSVEVLVCLVRLLNTVDETQEVSVALSSLLSSSGVPKRVFMGSSVFPIAMTCKSAVLGRLANALVRDKIFLRGLWTRVDEGIEHVLSYVGTQVEAFFTTEPRETCALLLHGSKHLRPIHALSGGFRVASKERCHDLSDISRVQFSKKWKLQTGETFQHERVSSLLALPWYTQRMLRSLVDSFALNVDEWLNVSLSVCGGYRLTPVPANGIRKLINDRVTLWSLGLNPTHRNEIMCHVNENEELTLLVSVNGKTRLTITAAVDSSDTLRVACSVFDDSGETLFKESLKYQQC